MFKKTIKKYEVVIVETKNLEECIMEIRSKKYIEFSL